MDIAKVNNTTITILANMQCLIDAIGEFPKNDKYQYVVFKSQYEFRRYITNIEQKYQEIIFSHSSSPVKMYIPIDSAKDIYANGSIYQLSVVENLINELDKIIQLDNISLLPENKHYLTVTELDNDIQKLIDFVVTDKNNEGCDFEMLKPLYIYKKSSQELQQIICERFVSLFKEKYNFHLNFESELKPNDTYNLYTNLWKAFSHTK
jgi:hypothetical protein